MKKLSPEEKALRKRKREAKESLIMSISFITAGALIYFLVPHDFGGGVGRHTVIGGSISLVLLGIVCGIMAAVLRFKKGK